MFECFNDKAILDNYGLFQLGDNNKKLKIIIETSSLSSVPPSFVVDNCIFHMEITDSRVLQVLKTFMEGVSYSCCEEKSRTEHKNDDVVVEIKYFEKK